MGVMEETENAIIDGTLDATDFVKYEEVQE